MEKLLTVDIQSKYKEEIQGGYQEINLTED